jgi:tetratricopeptide (TPR) repeat protein
MSDRKRAPAGANQERLLGLAGVYRNMSRKELARALGRDASNLFPANGNPKLDYLANLARVLDWPVGAVAEAILNHDVTEPSATPAGTFAELDAAALEAHRTGAYAALAALREAGGWDGRGRYTKQLEALRRGVEADASRRDLVLLLQANLANAYYTLWYLLEARGMARDLVDGFDIDEDRSRAARASYAVAHYVHGNASRRLLAKQTGRHGDHARSACEKLESAVRLYTALADEFDHAPWRGIATTCRGGIIEAEVELERVSARDALDRIATRLAAVTSEASEIVGDQLESAGWWCIFGCNIALRHLPDRELQREMGVLTQTGCEIAERLGNWAMLERLFTLELAQRRRLNDLAGVEVDWMIDNKAVEGVIGTMGRFPSFRKTGWQILRSATPVGSREA